MRSRFLLGATLVVASFAVAATGLVGTAVAKPGHGGHGGGAYTCTGGSASGDPSTWVFSTIPSGNYKSITVAGVCQTAPGAVINVKGDINVAPGAIFDAQSFTATIKVKHNITAGEGSLLGLGCQPEGAIGTQAGVPCNDDPNGQTVITVKHNISADKADTVFIRGVKVGHNVSLNGGGGAIPWSIKGSWIGHNLKIDGVTAEWLGVQFNHVKHNAVLTNITVVDSEHPGGKAAIVENWVRHNLVCEGIVPGVTPGFIPGETNHVGHKATGQCADISVKI